MEIHELNSKALTDPAYIAVDDGADTYKFDVKSRFDAYDALPDAIDALNAESKLHYFATSSAANAFTKEVTLANLSDIRVGDYIVILFENGNTATIFSIKFNVTPVSDVFGVLNFYDLTDKPTIKEGMALMFHVSSIVYPAGETDIVMDYVGPAITSGGGGGGTSDYTDLTNKPQINGVTLSGNKSLADLGISTYIDSYIAANYEDGDSAVY